MPAVLSFDDLVGGPNAKPSPALPTLSFDDLTNDNRGELQAPSGSVAAPTQKTLSFDDIAPASGGFVPPMADISRFQPGHVPPEPDAPLTEGQPDNRRGLLTRMKEGAEFGMGEGPLGISPENIAKYPALEMLQIPARLADTPLRVIGGMLGAVGGGIGGLVEHFTGDHTMADRAEREFNQYVMSKMGEMGGAHPQASPRVRSSPAEIESFLGTERGLRLRQEIDDFVQRRDAAGGPGAPLALPAPRIVAPPAEAPAGMAHPPAPAEIPPTAVPTQAVIPALQQASTAERLALRGHGLTDEQISAMPREQIDAAIESAAEAQIPPETPNDRQNGPGLPSPVGDVGAQPQQAQPVAGAGGAPAQAGGVFQSPQAGEIAKPPGHDVTGRHVFEQILNDPRSADEIRQEVAAHHGAMDAARAADAAVAEAARNWQPTPEWQDVPKGATLAPGLEIEAGPTGQQRARLAPTPGTRAAPIDIQAPHDLDAIAGNINPNPTPGQKDAENYAMAHGKIHGLPISVETAKGATRTAKDGSWEVPNFPAHYGRFKGTKGADGDHVDFFYDGPHPFIIDQLNPATGRFDEHKLVFANDETHARGIYERAFTDGKAGQRLGEITPVSVDQLKAWLANGNTKKPFAWTPPKHISTAPRLPTGPLTLKQFLASKGGLRADPGGELKSLGLTGKTRVVVPGLGYRNLIRGAGMTLDQAREAAVEAGYLHDPGWKTDQQATTTPDDLLRMLSEEEGGRQSFRQGEELTGQDRQVERQKEADQYRLEAAHAEVQAAVKEHRLLATDEQIREAAELTLTHSLDPLDAVDHIVERDALAGEREAEQSLPAEPRHDIQAAAAAESARNARSVSVEHGAASSARQANPPTVQQPARPGPQETRAAPARLEPGKDQRSRGEAEAPVVLPKPTQAPAATAPEKPAQPSTERGAEGKPQLVIPGAERLPADKLAQKKSDQPLKPTVAQKPADEGLFSDESKQTDLVDMARKPPPVDINKPEPPKTQAPETGPSDSGAMLKTKGGLGNQSPDLRGPSYRTPRERAAVRKLADDLRQELDRLGLSDVHLRVVERINALVDGKLVGADGRYFEKAITLALESSGDHKAVLHHEALHALRDLGLFKETEWALLAQASERKWRSQFDIDGRYKEASEADKIEEGVAHAYAAWTEGKATVDGRLARLFKRIRDFFKGIGHALRKFTTGHDIKTAEDVFEAIRSGEVGRRERAEVKAEGARYALTRTPHEKAVLDRVVASDEKAARKLTLNDVYTAVKDDLNPIRVLRNALAEGKTLEAKEDPYVLARLTRGTYGKAQQFLEGGTFDFHSLKTTGKSLKEILQPVKQDLDGLRAYAVSKRALELAGRDIRTGVPTEAARQTVAAGRAKYEPVFQELQVYQRSLTEYLRDSGIIGNDGYASMIAANKDYVPFFRMMGDTDLGRGLGGGLKVKDPVKGIRGSDRQIIDPIESIIKNTHLFISLAERNRALVALADLADKSPHGNDLMPKVNLGVHAVEVTGAEVARFLRAEGVDPKAAESLTIFRPNTFRPDENHIAVFRDGKREVRRVDKDVAAAVNALDRESANLVTRIMAVPARTLRAGAVLAPEFIARNPVRDQFEAFLMSEHGYVPVYDFLRGLGSVLAKGDAYQRWLKSGAANAAMVAVDRDYINQNVLKLEKPGALDRVKNIVKSPLEALRILSELMENATRVGEFKRAIGKGKSDFAAGFASREVTLDFARAGAQTRALNLIIPFWNAQVEGTDRLARGFANRPLTTLFKVALAITLPSVLLWVANHDDDRWKELPRWQRDLFWIIPTDKWEPFRVKADDGGMREATDDDVGNRSKRSYMRKRDGKWEINNGTIWHIPKPFAPGILFGSMPERLLDAYVDTAPKPLKNVGSALLQAVLPNFVPQAALPILEHWANRSFFRDRPVVPKYLEDVRAKFQATNYTTETAQALAKIIAKINDETSFGSPIVIENYVRAWTGGLGMHAMQAMDKALTATGVAPEKVEPTKAWADMPVIRAFVARFPGAGAQSVEDFYDEWQKRKTNAATVKYLAKTGHSDEAQSEADAHPLATAERIHKALGAQASLIRNMYRDKTMKPDEKRALIDQTYLQMIELAKAGNTILRATENRPSSANRPNEPVGADTQH